MSEKTKKRLYERFPRSYRIEHILLLISFSILGITGLAQKFFDVGVSEWFVGLLGGVERVRIVHRLAAIMMMLETVYHLGVVVYRVFVQRSRLTMLPGMDDLRALIQALMYNVGLSKERPLEGRFSVAEKMEYWALVWGTVVMGITGFMLWNPIATTKVLPGEFIPAAKVAHSAEALLAITAIIIWHFYHVHFKFFNKSIFTGKLTEEQMAHEHPLELAAIVDGTSIRPVDSQAMAKRRRIFVPLFAISAVLMLVCFYFFVTFEETALATYDPIEDAEVYVPLTPTPYPTPLPTPTPVPVVEQAGGPTWDGAISPLFQQQCGACHSSASPLGGLDVTSYEDLLAGGANGLGVAPGDPDASTIIARQVTGDHPGQFDGADLALLREWIEADAPEN